MSELLWQSVSGLQSRGVRHHTVLQIYCVTSNVRCAIFQTFQTENWGVSEIQGITF